MESEVARARRRRVLVRIVASAGCARFRRGMAAATIGSSPTVGAWDWEFTVSASAGAGLPGSHRLASNVTFEQCLAACAQRPSCSAVDYVKKHGDASSRLKDRLGLRCARAHKPTRHDCFSVPVDNWRPCLQPETENLCARKRPLPKAPANAKNVLFVIFDDLRVLDEPYRHLAAPATAAFAAGGTTFLNAHAQSALCAPSRASFLSGRRPDVTRVYWTDSHLRQWPHATSWTTLPQHFRSHGYYVAAAGKLFHHNNDPASLDPASWSEPECVASYPYYGQGQCPIKQEVLFHKYNTTVACPVDTAELPGYAFTDRQVLAKGLDFLRRAAPAARSGERPFWLGVGFFKPHKPFVFPDELLRRMPHLSEVSLAANGEPPSSMPPVANIAELCATKPAGSPRSRCAHDTIRTYHAAAAFTDGLLGELLGELDAQKLQQETLVSLVSDHGFALGEHGAWAKWTNWDVATRVPFIIRAPWVAPSYGARITSPVELLDLYPTVAELAGVPLPAPRVGGYVGVGGRSLAPLMSQPSNTTGGVAYSQIARCWPAGDAPHDASTPMAQCDRVALSDYAYMGYSIRTDRARYTEWVPTRWDAETSRLMPQWGAVVGTELYEHGGERSADFEPSWTVAIENTNLVSERPAEAASLRHKLRAHFDGTLEQARSLHVGS